MQCNNHTLPPVICLSTHQTQTLDLTSERFPIAKPARSLPLCATVHRILVPGSFVTLHTSLFAKTRTWHTFCFRWYYKILGNTMSYNFLLNITLHISLMKITVTNNCLAVTTTVIISGLRCVYQLVDLYLRKSVINGKPRGLYKTLDYLPA